MVGILMQEGADSGRRLTASLRNPADRLRKLSTRLFQALSHRSWRGAIVEPTNVGNRQCSNCIPIFVQNRIANVDNSFDLVTFFLLIASLFNGSEMRSQITRNRRFVMFAP